MLSYTASLGGPWGAVPPLGFTHVLTAGTCHIVSHPLVTYSDCEERAEAVPSLYLPKHLLFA